METTTKTTTFKSFYQMLEVLPNDNACRLFLEDLRWNGTPVCPHCGSVNESHYKLNTKGVFNGLYKCKDCRERLTVTVGTMFEGSHVPLRKWFIAIYIFTAHKKGISSIQLGKDLGITQKSAWFVLSRLRNNFQAKSDIKFDGIIQCDESFLGGKNKNKHASKRTENAQGRSVKDKTPVFGMIENGDQVYTQVIADTKATTLKPIIEKLVEKGAIIVSDEWNGYTGLKKDYKHTVVNHNGNEFKNDLGFHNNGIEGFWSLLKRGIYGIYHQVSPKHLNKYCDEFAFRYNTRKITDSEKFSLSLLKAESRLTYKQLIAK
jgi:transposase-like protein